MSLIKMTQKNLGFSIEINEEKDISVSTLQDIY
jgi:hypothetical protein